ncbi:MAG: TlpA family protein disulfide reductase [Chitinispirillia bacterium]|nr:TlpA family protein disulfide reductase [Chitinispirillia bacterium]
MIILTVLFSVSFAQAELSVRLELPEQLKRNTLPQFSARDRDGENLFQRRHLERMIEPEAKRVVLVFFATWCVPCAKSAMTIKKTGNSLKENGVQVVFVNAGERDVGAIHKWIKQYGDPSLPLIIDNRSQMSGAFGLLEPNGTTIVPKKLVLDRKLKPLFLLGAEGSDFPGVLWERNH